MKVSKKVARRSRSSVSRRRLMSKKSYKKHSYRKNNTKTQKGGKRGRGQKRVRVHTHKRGKRFHKGGKNMPFFGSVPPARLEYDSNTKAGFIYNLRYKKFINNIPKDKYDDFEFKIIQDTKGEYNITFRKIAGKSIFSFKTGLYNRHLEHTAMADACNAIRNGNWFRSVTPYVDNDSVSYQFVSDPNLTEQFLTILPPCPPPPYHYPPYCEHSYL